MNRSVGSGPRTLWAAQPIDDRLALVRRFRRALAAAPGPLLAAIKTAIPGRNPTETFTAEILPLADACRFLEREAAAILSSHSPGAAARPFWLGRIDLEVRREPRGVVLILGPANYPLLLPAVQALQALTAGNAVRLKPGQGGRPVALALRHLLVSVGLDPHLFEVLGEEVEPIRAMLHSPDRAPDLVVLTGSSATGRAVLADLAAAPHPIPVILELSGCDAVFVLPDASSADLDRAAKAIRFGRTWNDGATCIAPRRLFVPRPLAENLAARLLKLGEAPGEGTLEVYEVADLDEALALDATCPYALGATIFGPEEAARQLALKVRAGTIVVNDMIVPTADPRLPFGARGASGYGVTRGAEGLLEMTVPKAITVRRGRFLPHLAGARAADAPIFGALLGLAHGSWKGRWHALFDLFRAIRNGTDLVCCTLQTRFKRSKNESGYPGLLV